MISDEELVEIELQAKLNLPIKSEEWRRETFIRVCRDLRKAKTSIKVKDAALRDCHSFFLMRIPKHREYLMADIIAQAIEVKE